MSNIVPTSLNPNFSVIDTKILNIVPQEKLDVIAAAYKVHLLKDKKHKPNVYVLFKHAGLTRAHYDKCVGLLGNITHLHEYLRKDVPIENDAIIDLLKTMITEAKVRIKKMDDKAFNDLLRVVADIVSAKPANSPAMQVNFDINEQLASRIIDDEKLT